MRVASSMPSELSRPARGPRNRFLFFPVGNFDHLGSVVMRWKFKRGVAIAVRPVPSRAASWLGPAASGQQAALPPLPPSPATSTHGAGHGGRPAAHKKTALRCACSEPRPACTRACVCDTLRAPIACAARVRVRRTQRSDAREDATGRSRRRRRMPRARLCRRRSKSRSGRTQRGNAG